MEHRVLVLGNEVRNDKGKCCFRVIWLRVSQHRIPSRHERIEAAIARAIRGGSSTKARFIKGRERQETRHGMGKINTEAKFRGQECYGLGEILPERPRVEIRIAETNRNGIVAKAGSLDSGGVQRAVGGQIKVGRE